METLVSKFFPCSCFCMGFCVSQCILLLWLNISLILGLSAFKEVVFYWNFNLFFSWSNVRDKCLRSHTCMACATHWLHLLPGGIICQGIYYSWCIAKWFILVYFCSLETWLPAKHFLTKRLWIMSAQNTQGIIDVMRLLSIIYQSFIS